MADTAHEPMAGQEFDHAIFFGENVDIHHIFPQDWCKKKGINPKVFDSIINKTPLAYRSNRIIGGAAPSEYLSRLEKGNNTTPPIDRQRLDLYLTSHLIDPSLLRTDNFDDFMVDRQRQLLSLIEQATGKTAYTGSVQEEGELVESDEDTVQAELTIAE